MLQEIIFPGSDEAFFRDHPDRRLRIRMPRIGEYVNEFASLGMHNKDRERVIVARMPRNVARATGVKWMPIPFLLFADETVEDRDDILGPIFTRIMDDASKGIGL